MTRTPLKEILKYQDKKSKEKGMYETHLQYGCILKKIAEYIAVHYTTVSRQLKKLKREDDK
jgi:DNA-binding MarR family transcriptional regulator